MIYWTLAGSFALTLIVELALIRLLGWRGRSLLLAALANCLTNPPVVLLATLFGGRGLELALEALAVVAEGALYAGLCGEAHPWRVSVAANALSYGLGLLLNLL